MAAKQIVPLATRKRELIEESAYLREDLQAQCRNLAPGVAALEKGYEVARAAGSVWNFTSPLRKAGNGKWVIPQILFRFLKGRFF